MGTTNQTHGIKLRIATRLMLVSQIIMVAAIITQYFAPLYVAPVIATSFYFGLWLAERNVGITSPVTLLMTLFYLVFSLARYLIEDQSWLVYAPSVIYFTLAMLVFGFLLCGKPFTSFYSDGKGFAPLHLTMSIVWGVLHVCSGLAGYFLIPSIMFLYVPLGLMILGSIVTLWLNFVSMGQSYERKTNFVFGNFNFREAKTQEDREIFYRVVAKSYRADVQKALGMRRRVDEDMIITAHKNSDDKRGGAQIPFIVFEGDIPIGSICLFLDNSDGLPIEGETDIDLTFWRKKGRVAEVGRLGLVRTHRFNQMALKGLFKCVVEVAAEKSICYILNDSFYFQVSLYKKIGFLTLVDQPYLCPYESTSGFGLECIPMIMDLANMVRLDDETNITADVHDILSPYVIERFFKRLVIKEVLDAIPVFRWIGLFLQKKDNG